MTSTCGFEENERNKEILLYEAREACESLVSPGASANAGGGAGACGHVGVPRQAWSALSPYWGEDDMTISSVFCLCKRNCPDWVWWAGWRSLSLFFLIFFFRDQNLIQLHMRFFCFFFSLLLHFFFFRKCFRWEIIPFSCPLWWPFANSR